MTKTLARSGSFTHSWQLSVMHAGPPRLPGPGHSAFHQLMWFPTTVGATPPEHRLAPRDRNYSPHVPNGSAMERANFHISNRSIQRLCRVRVGSGLQQLAWCLADGQRSVPAPRGTDGVRLALVRSSPAFTVTARLGIAVFSSLLKKATVRHASPWRTTAAKEMVRAFQPIMVRGSIHHRHIQTSSMR